MGGVLSWGISGTNKLLGVFKKLFNTMRLVLYMYCISEHQTLKVVKLLLLDILTQINITPQHYDIAEHSIANIRT